MSTTDPEPARTDRLDQRLEFETLVADLSSRFVNLPPAEVDGEIESALRRFCELLGIDLAVLWQWSGEAPSLLTPTHAYYFQGELRPSDPLRQEEFPWWLEQLLAGRSVAVTSLEELPAEAAVDRETCRALGVKSNLTLPLLVGGEQLVGVLGFNTLRAERDWPDPLVTRLHLVAQIFTNALARRRADQALRESEEINRATFEQAAVGIAHVGTDGRWLRVNDRLCAIVGYPREELLQMTFEDITHPEDLKAGLDKMRAVLSGEIKTYSLEKRYIRRNRSLVWIHLNVSLVRTAAGAPRYFIGVIQDIGERKRVEEALRASEARLKAGASLARLGYYEVDFGEAKAFFDDRLSELCGVPKERQKDLEPVKFWIDHLHPDDRQRVLGLREELHDGRLEELAVDYRYLHPTLGERWLHHQAGVTIRDAAGHSVRSYGVVRDITERRRSEETLRESLAEIGRLKDRLQAEADYLRAEIRVIHPHGEITGQSPAIRKVLHSVNQVASTDSTVLISGETGSGKELVAAAIHQLSPRRASLMVTVNCAALPSGLVESELFGREKGAYTGALTRQNGRFEVADGSTLFLDEVGELSLDVQAKLLRVLETGKFERLGSPKTVKVDVRVLAATNRDLAESTRKGHFRQDLYYRLSVFPIRVPPLRERAEDIPELVWTFLREFSTRMGKKITQVPRTTMEELQRRPWPGNVRELRNVIEHATIVTTGEVLRVPLADGVAPEAAPATTLADAERDHILRALERAGWHVKGPKGAAAELGLHPATLYSRMKKLGLWPRRRVEHGSA